MIIALLIGREASTGFPNKNIHPVLGRPLMEYPLVAARNSKLIDRIYISTDSEAIKEIGTRNGALIINRPDYLCTKEALGEDVFVHGYQYIKDELKKPMEFMILLFCNVATVTTELIETGIRILREHPEYDSAVSVSSYNMWSPLRARKINQNGLLQPFVPFETFGDPDKLNCDRDSQGEVWFADMGVSVVRPRCLENIKEGLLPQRWMGKHIYPLKQWGGCDIDFKWQIPLVEYWLKKHGFSKIKTPYKKEDLRK